MIYRFDDCELDTELYTSRKTDAPLTLEPNVFDMLHVLIEHRARVVTKRELLTPLWPRQDMSKATLNHVMMAARKATGDNGRQQRTLQTIRGRGYRFAAHIDVVDRPLPDCPLAGDDVAISEMQAGLVAVRDTGAELFRPFFGVLLADVYGPMGCVDEGLRAFEEALTIRAKTGERLYESELYRPRDVTEAADPAVSFGRLRHPRVAEDKSA